MIVDIDDLMNRTNETSKLRRQAFSHRIAFTGNLNGNIGFEKRKYLVDHIYSTYGK
jgi:hypothetical protein